MHGRPWLICSWYDSYSPTPRLRLIISVHSPSKCQFPSAWCWRISQEQTSRLSALWQLEGDPKKADHTKVITSRGPSLKLQKRFKVAPRQVQKHNNTCLLPLRAQGHISLSTRWMGAGFYGDCWRIWTRPSSCFGLSTHQPTSTHSSMH